MPDKYDTGLVRYRKNMTMGRCVSEKIYHSFGALPEKYDNGSVPFRTGIYLERRIIRKIINIILEKVHIGQFLL